jgi:hypothetical protein
VNLVELRAATRTLINDQAPPYRWPDVDIDRRLNNAVREACIRARLVKDNADSRPDLCSIAYTAGQRTVAYAKEILVVRNGSIVGQCHKLWAVTADSMDLIWPEWDSTSMQPATPKFMVMDLSQKTIRLSPTPAIDGVLNLRVWRMPTANDLMTADESVPLIAIPDPEELCHWAAAECYQVKDSEVLDASAAANELSLFEQRFGPRPSLEEMARWADSPPRIRHAHMF